MSSSAVTDALRSHILSLSTALDPSDPPPPDILEKETINRASVISLTKIAAKKSSVASLPVPSTSSKTIVASAAAAVIKPLLSRTSSHSTIKHFKRPSTSNNETSAAMSSTAIGSAARGSAMTSGGGLVVVGKPTPASDKSSTYSFDTAKESLEPGYYTAMSETSSPRTSKELKRGISCESCRIFFENHGRLPLRPKHASSPSSTSSFPELAPPPVVAVTPPHSPKSKRGKAPSSLHSVHSIQEQPVASTSSYQTRQQPHQLQKNRDFTRINNNNNVEEEEEEEEDDDHIEKDQRIPATGHLLKCGLCQESVHRRGLPCGHVYCRDCLIKLAEDADGRSEAMAQWLEEKKRFWNPPIPPTVPMYGAGGPVPWGYPVMPGGVPQMERSRTAPFSYDTSFASNNNDRHSRAYTMEMYERERGFERGMTPIYPSIRRPPLSTSAREVEDDGVPSTKPVVAPPNKRRLLIRGLLFLSALGGISVCIKAYTLAEGPLPLQDGLAFQFLIILSVVTFVLSSAMILNYLMRRFRRMPKWDTRYVFLVDLFLWLFLLSDVSLLVARNTCSGSSFCSYYSASIFFGSLQMLLEFIATVWDVVGIFIDRRRRRLKRRQETMQQVQARDSLVQ